MVTTIVGKWEGQLDVGTFNKNIAADGTIE